VEDKLLTFVARTVAAIITGGGLLTFTNGAWIGRLMLGSFEQTTQIRILNQHLLSDDLYRDWGREILFGSAPTAIGAPALVYLGLTLLLVGHVLYKAAVCEGRVPVFKGGGRGVRIARTLCSVYVKHYHLVTFILVLDLGLVLFIAPTRGALVTRFLLFAVPVVLYLVYYVKDIRSSSFKDVFLYAANLLLFCAAVFALPSVFGQRFFDVEMRQVPPKIDAEDKTYLASFVVDEERRVVGHIYGQENLKLELEQVEALEAGISSVSLRKLATDTAARKVADPGAASSEIDRLLGESRPSQ
jgi:hypothetical protein